MCLQELPELVYLHPPLTIFIMEQRAFGRLVLVGTHVVQNLVQFGPRDQEEWKDEEEVPEGMEPFIAHMFVVKGQKMKHLLFWYVYINHLYSKVDQTLFLYKLGWY